MDITTAMASEVEVLVSDYYLLAFEGRGDRHLVCLLWRHLSSDATASSWTESAGTLGALHRRAACY